MSDKPFFVDVAGFVEGGGRKHVPYSNPKRPLHHQLVPAQSGQATQAGAHHHTYLSQSSGDSMEALWPTLTPHVTSRTPHDGEHTNPTTQRDCPSICLGLYHSTGRTSPRGVRGATLYTPAHRPA